MTDRQPSAKDLAQATPLAMKNPYILNFCKVLVEKKGEKHTPAALKKLLDDMYRLFENLLGQNMVKALPEYKRKEYLQLCDDLNQISYEKIAEIFDKHVPNYREIMKKTMIQFTELFMKNRGFNPEQIKKEFASMND